MTAKTRRSRLAMWLRGRGPTTVGEAADRFEVSERTIFRDLAALRRRGVPVLGDPGRGGGIWLRKAA
jgi:predicted DNA-binding transcriptional regulator YafY